MRANFAWKVWIWLLLHKFSSKLLNFFWWKLFDVSFHQNIQKVFMNIEEMANVFRNSANFAPHACLTIAPLNGYALNLQALIKVSKVGWTSQLLYEILRSLFERKFDRTNFISAKNTSQKPTSFLKSLLYVKIR